MSECYEHEKRRRQGSACPYCVLEAAEQRIAELEAERSRMLARSGQLCVSIDTTYEDLQAENERLRAALKHIERMADCDEVMMLWDATSVARDALQ